MPDESRNLPQKDAPKHWVSKTCIGEKCRCGKDAAHKVGEEIAHDAPAFAMSDDVYAIGCRHNLTAYVCCQHFAEIMGWLAKEQCGV